MEKVNFYALCNEKNANTAGKSLASALHAHIDLSFPKKVLTKKEWDKICREVTEKRCEWLLIDIGHLQRSIPITESELLLDRINQLFEQFDQGFPEGVLILDPLEVEKRKEVQQLANRFKFKTILIKYPDEIEIVVKPKDHLTIWIEDDHMHFHCRRYCAVPRVGIIEHSVSGKRNLSYYSKKAKRVKTYNDYIIFAEDVGQKFRLYLEKQSSKSKLKKKKDDDIFKELLTPDKGLRNHGPIYVIYENQSHFPLPFEYIIQNQANGKMLGFRNPVLHLSPNCSPPDLDIPQKPLKFLLIDANAGKKVKIMHPKDKNLILKFGPLPGATREIKEIKRLLESYRGAVKINIIETVRYNEIKDILKEIIPGKFHIIHFAGHTEVLDNKVYFHWPLKGKENNLLPLNQIKKMFSWDFPWLLFLSSCSVGQDTRVFKMAESIPCIIAHRWKLFDDEGRVFAQTFYQNLLDNPTTPADALVFTRNHEHDKRASYSAIFICGRQN